MSPNINNSKYKNEIEETDSIYGSAIFFNLKVNCQNIFFMKKFLFLWKKLIYVKGIMEKSGKIYKINKAKIKHTRKSSNKYSLKYEAILKLALYVVFFLL